MKFIFGMHINIEVFYKLIVSFRVCVTRHAQSTLNNKFSISLQYLQKSIGGEVGFLPVDKRESFLQGDSIVLGVDSQHAQSTQNDKFAISLQYIKENMNDEVGFLPADKCQRLLLIDTIILGVYGQACPNYPK